MENSTDHLPRRVRVKEIVSSRYKPGSRPVSWDERRAGVEVVTTVSGQSLKLFSGGGQSTPAPGWELLLTAVVGTADESGIAWTLYGIPQAAK